MLQFKVNNSQKENKSQSRILMVFFFVFFCFVVLFFVSNPTTGALRSVFLIFHASV